jgi:hypothetical protein
MAPLKSNDTKPYKHMQRTLTRAIEKQSAGALKAATEARSRTDTAHLNSCCGSWLLSAPLGHIRLTNALHKTRMRRYLRLSIPICTVTHRSRRQGG